VNPRGRPFHIRFGRCVKLAYLRAMRQYDKDWWDYQWRA